MTEGHVGWRLGARDEVREECRGGSDERRAEAAGLGELKRFVG